MMLSLWVVLLVALTGAPVGQGLPLRSTPEAYPHDTRGESLLQAWSSGTGLYAAVPALALVLTALGLLFGCTWCYRHKDCKQPNGGADNQLFTASATQLHDGRRSQPPDSGFSEPVNNNISEDNNNGPISLREMQNIANNNAAAYIVSENEERNRSRESVVEFEPLPSAIRVVDPLERCADWFAGEDLPRNRLQYLREIGRGWFGRVVEGEIEEDSGTSTVAVKILNQNASLEDKARFLDEAKLYRDVTHENILAFIAKCLHEDPWLLMFELCSMDLQQYLIHNRPKMAILNESGVPLQLLCDVSSALSHLHSRGYLYGNICSSNILVREPSGSDPRGVLGSYSPSAPAHEFSAPETRRHPPQYTASSEVWSLGTLIWEVCTWGAPVPNHQPPPPDLPCPYRNHLYQVMQLCWNPNAESRPTAAQVHALLNHLHTTHAHTQADTPLDDGAGTSDFEERWQTLKPNTIPKIDEHVALVHAPSTSQASHFTGSDQEFDNPPTTQDTLSVDMDTAVSRSSSIMSDKDPLSVQIKSESMTNLHGSLEDVRNIYLTHNESAALECHQGNISLEERELDRSDGSVDPWVKDLIAGSQDDVSYYKDVSDVIKNLDNILNSEKTSSSESSHQASPSRDNLSLDCKKENLIPSSMVKSPGISNFKNILEMGFDMSDEKDEPCDDEEIDRDTIGTLSHSFERHSDTTSQHTLENLTPETPIKDIDVVSTIESQDDAKQKCEHVEENIKTSETHQNTELPKENIYSSHSVPKESVVSFSVSEINEQLNLREDCVTPCDNLAEIRTQVETKSIVNTVHKNQNIHENTDKSLAPEIESDNNQYGVTNLKEDLVNINEEHAILPEVVKEIAVNLVENEILHPAIEIVSKLVQAKEEPENKLKNEDKPQSLDVRENSGHMKSINDLKNSTSAFINEESKLVELVKLEESHSQSEDTSATSVPVQISNKVTTETNQTRNDKAEPSVDIHEEELLAFSSNFGDMNLQTLGDDFILPTPDLVQTTTEKADTSSIDKEETKEVFITKTIENVTNEENLISNNEDSNNSEVLDRNEFSPRSENVTEHLNDSTAYMDLINYTTSKANNSEIAQDHVKDCIQSCLVMPSNDASCSIIRNESTVYLDLPSVLKETHDFINAERETADKATSQFDDIDICASTPKGSECSQLETSVSNEIDTEIVSKTKVPSEIEAAIKEQKQIADLLSPFESPTKSHPTETYEENSSVVLGPFESYTTEYKDVKNVVELPKEELLAFSSNFSEISLETPSPLRDGNFLNEVPDIAPEDVQLEDVTLSEAQKDKTEDSDETEDSGTTKRISPSTPPNSPGIYLASTSSQKYLVDIDLDLPETQSYPPIDTDSGLSSLQKEIDLNQIELQITTKLAMAENENNMNIEYSGPLTVEGLVSEDDAILRESDAMPEAFLAGNIGTIEDRSEGLSLDEECVKALRNELELKLPLAQVAGIEPACEPEWGELPPPPELVVSYALGGALSPIAEETRHQLSAYENDAWIPSNRTDSSESYPEPCNDSTAEVTDLPTGAVGSNDHSTYTIMSKDNSVNNTYTVQKDIPTSRELTMSADSLNGSPYKKPAIAQSPIDDRTYNKEEDKVSNCERISQVSPCLMSPTTDSSAPDSVDNATRVSTLSKTSIPTDAKHSKPSECLSKATSIDSWCSNDTLYNVEENFDDLVVDAELPQFENDKVIVKSASTETLTRQEDEKEVSHCSTYIVHDSKSEACDSFSPDSITANDNYTYTKVKTEATGVTPSVATKSEVNDSTKSQTKDLAYETLPSYSNCTTELVSGLEDPWKFAQPELVRRSPVAVELDFTPPRIVEDKNFVLNDSPQINESTVNKMDSVNLTCLQDDISGHKSESADSNLIDNNSPQNDYKSNMAPSITSTPITEQILDDENVEAIPMNLPNETESSEALLNSIPPFQAFVHSAENRPQDITCNQDSEQLLEADSKTLSRNSYRDSIIADRTPTYSDFEMSAAMKFQEVNSDKSSQLIESGTSSVDFNQFENSVRSCPQDLSSLRDANYLFLNNERIQSDLVATSNTESLNQQTSQVSPMPDLIQTISPTNITSLVESQPPSVNFSMFVTDLDEEETDQPHSIIFTELRQTTKDVEKTDNISDKESTPPKNEIRNQRESPDIPVDSQTELISNLTHTYDSQSVKLPAINTNENNTKNENKVTEIEHKVNGIYHVEENFEDSAESARPDVLGDPTISKKIDIPNGITDPINQAGTCNGNSQNYATVNFIHETFEELADNHINESKISKETTETTANSTKEFAIEIETPQVETQVEPHDQANEKIEVTVNGVEDKMVTDNFLQNEKKYCALDSYLTLFNSLDIRFSGPATEIMSTSFTQDSPTEPTSPECERDSKTDAVADIVKEWDSDSESHDSNSSSGEFIWKDGDGHETPVVPSTHFDHQQKGAGGSEAVPGNRSAPSGGASEASGDSGSGSEGDEVEFVPSSWDCRAEPSKSSLRTLQRPTHPAAADNKKRVVFKRQKYHCVYEYPRELADAEHSPAYMPDFSTYCDWDRSSAEAAELYGTIDMYMSGISFGSDYDEDFFISSSARPFESLGVMSSSSQFFPGMHLKPAILDSDVTEDFPPPPSPLTAAPAAPAPAPPTATPSLDFTTPDSGVEDITPGSTTTEEDFKTKKLPGDDIQSWKPIDSASSSESVSPSSPGAGEALGGLRHTRDKLKLDLPPSPHVPPSPRHNRVFNFVLDKPKRHRVPDERPADVSPAPLVMSDETPIVTTTLPIQRDDENVSVPEPTFSTFGKSRTSPKPAEVESPEQKIILTDQESQEVKVESPKVEAVKGEGTVLDSGDEDSGIESSSKATLERKTNVS